MAAVKFQCDACGQPLEAPEEAAGCHVPCPSCHQPLRVPTPTEDAPGLAPTQTAAPANLCAICQSPLVADEPKSACPECHAEYHADCWQENGGCAVYGCSEVPEIEQRRTIEIPVSFWGQENKPCPACGREILAAAVRCRYCGATFSSAQPEDAEQFQQRVARNERLPRIKRTVIWLFVFSIVPCVAPVGAVWGSIWYPANRHDVRALPSLYAALCKIGLTLSISQTVGIVVTAGLYTIRNAP